MKVKIFSLQVKQFERGVDLTETAVCGAVEM